MFIFTMWSTGASTRWIFIEIDCGIKHSKAIPAWRPHNSSRHGVMVRMDKENQWQSIK